MTKLELLRQISFGARIAEEEAAELEAYFVKTDSWNRIFAGQIDIIYGAKGAGKSAIYAVLEKNRAKLAERRVLITTAENPRGTPVFRDLVSDPPTSESEFLNLWRLYLLTLIGSALKSSGVDNAPANELLNQLRDAGLLKDGASLRSILKGALDYVRRLREVESIGTTVDVDPSRGVTAFTPKITFREPTAAEKEQGVASTDYLFKLANDALEAEKLSLWVLLDRLDVAFAETSELEQNGLRALFKVYLDLLSHARLALKIFIRSDIWRRITAQGFREASHIARHVTISWDESGLLNLIIRRLLKNPALVAHYGVNEADILQSYENQVQLFYRVFPDKVDLSDKKPTTLDWIVTRCADGTGIVAPREVIHLLSACRDEQVRKLERGDDPPHDDSLFSGQSFKDALREVSKTRFENTLLAEYPQYREALLKLEGKRTLQGVESLSEIWALPPEQARNLANALVECGFFESRMTKEQRVYWVPFLYRACLEMVQGTED